MGRKTDLEIELTLKFNTERFFDRGGVDYSFIDESKMIMSLLFMNLRDVVMLNKNLAS